MRALVQDGRLRLGARGLRGRELHGDYLVVGKSESPPKGKAIYICAGPTRLILRVPANSKAVPALDRMAEPA
jgi:hypothetical protein